MMSPLVVFVLVFMTVIFAIGGGVIGGTPMALVGIAIMLFAAICYFLILWAVSAQPSGKQSAK